MALLIMVVFTLCSCIYVEKKGHYWTDNSDETTVYRELIIDKDIIKLIKE